ncbi:MAG: hypothetical protein ACXVZX_12180, partial [Terriglobales bacterium]
AQKRCAVEWPSSFIRVEEVFNSPAPIRRTQRYLGCLLKLRNYYGIKELQNTRKAARIVAHLDVVEKLFVQRADVSRLAEKRYRYKQLWPIAIK